MSYNFIALTLAKRLALRIVLLIGDGPARIVSYIYIHPLTNISRTSPDNPVYVYVYVFYSL